MSTEVPVSLTPEEAASGATKAIDLPSGQATVTVPPTHDGDRVTVSTDQGEIVLLVSVESAPTFTLPSDPTASPEPPAATEHLPSDQPPGATEPLPSLQPPPTEPVTPLQPPLDRTTEQPVLPGDAPAPEGAAAMGAETPMRPAGPEGTPADGMPPSSAPPGSVPPGFVPPGSVPPGGQPPLGMPFGPMPPPPPKPSSNVNPAVWVAVGVAAIVVVLCCAGGMFSFVSNAGHHASAYSSYSDSPEPSDTDTYSPYDTDTPTPGDTYTSAPYDSPTDSPTPTESPFANGTCLDGTLPDSSTPVEVHNNEVDCGSPSAHYKVIQRFDDTTDLNQCQNVDGSQYAFSSELTMNGATVRSYVYCLVAMNGD